MSLLQDTGISSMAENWQQVVHAAGGGEGPDWLQHVRSRAAASFIQYGLPGNKDEAWKYTSLRRLEDLNPKLAAVEPVGGSETPELTPEVDALFGDIRQGFRLTGGQLKSLAGKPISGLSLMSLQEAVSSGDAEYSPQVRGLLENLQVDSRGLAFEALNTALLNEGVVIHVAAGVDAGTCSITWAEDQPSPALLGNFRVIVLLESGARLRLCEKFEGEQAREMHGQALNIVVQAELGKGSELKHIRVQNGGSENILFTSSQVKQAADSYYRYTGFDVGGGLVRHSMSCSLVGQAARAELSGAFVLDGQRHVDNHICVDHVAPACSSDQFFRGVLGGKSRGVFNGKAIIQAGADGSRVRQSNANLLLSDTAEIDTKPELEIYADEVEASHGATVGQMDEQAVFYLRSRGIGETQARKMLTMAFCRTVTERLAEPELAEQLGLLLDRSMPAFELNPGAGD